MYGESAAEPSSHISPLIFPSQRLPWHCTDGALIQIVSLRSPGRNHIPLLKFFILTLLLIVSLDEPAWGTLLKLLKPHPKESVFGRCSPLLLQSLISHSLCRCWFLPLIKFADQQSWFKSWDLLWPRFVDLSLRIFVHLDISGCLGRDFQTVLQVAESIHTSVLATASIHTVALWVFNSQDHIQGEKTPEN